MSEPSAPPEETHRPATWRRAWSAGVARLPVSGWPTGRWRRIGLACAGVALVVVLAGALTGSLLGAGALKLTRALFAPEPLIAQETLPAVR
ncbi:hypothetical protein [Alsobacter sp. R-9]